MTVHRLSLYRSDDPFTRVPNVTINDQKLDLKARGLLVFMLSKPDGWTFRERALADQTGVSREQVRTALARLTAAGYVRRVRRIVDGKPRLETHVFDVAQLEGTDPVPATVRDDDGRESVPVSNERVQVTNTTPRQDVLFETVCSITGHDPKQLTSSERGKINRALKDLRAVGATPDDVRARAQSWGKRYPNATLTPTALAAHWSSLQSPSSVRAASLDPELEAIREASRRSW
jgi:DNA-binding Lrp family transcriptional regulator